ncbi:MAG: cupin domain-containing protein [Gammaproteobacteria bacterium]
MKSSNILRSIPGELSDEVFEDIIQSTSVRIERIISKGHTSPEQGWYDQDENEWVMLVDGSATIEFENGVSLTLSKGDYVNIPAHKKHKVSWSDPGQITIWLAVFYS